ncbi:FAD binding domain-containing protein [Colletotrichum tofieldiae]|nr:FAD binding domain-containing protein [Colletotrichum tofieldiae]GKT73726.1 FAD binding domain-containing protein [Colletotrichum tofieldiae]
MGKTYYGPDLPRFTKEDEAVLVKEHQNDRITEKFSFRDLYSAKISSVLTPLPEYVFKKWHFNRIMTIGDAAHKFEPIAGQGGNSAIETAAVLVNNLVTMLKAYPSSITTDQIQDVFSETQKKREQRVWDLVRASHNEQRFAAMESPLIEFIGRYMAPKMSIDDKEDPWSTNIEGGHKIDLLDVPERIHATPFFDELISRPLNPSTLPKLLVGVILCGILYLAQKVLLLSPGAFAGTNNFLGHALKKDFTGFPQVDSILSILVWAFSESTSGPDPNKILQCLYFLMNLIPLIYIWTVEGYRNGNNLTLVSWPSLFAMYQLVGIGKVAPVYFLISLYTTRRGVYYRPTGRPIPSSVARVLPASLCFGYVLPTVLMFIQYGDNKVQQNAIAFWQLSPVYVSILTWGFSGFLRYVSPTNKSLDWEIFENKDIFSLQIGYAVCFFITAVLHICVLIYAYFSPPVSLFTAFFDLPNVAAMSLGNDIGGFWKYDMILCFGAVAIWCLFSVYELRRLGYVTMRTAIVAAVSTLLGHILVGPGATYAALWAWREDVIAQLIKQ